MTIHNILAVRPHCGQVKDVMIYEGRGHRWRDDIPIHIWNLMMKKYSQGP